MVVEIGLDGIDESWERGKSGGVVGGTKDHDETAVFGESRFELGIDAPGDTAFFGDHGTDLEALDQCAVISDGERPTTEDELIGAQAGVEA